MFARLTQSIIYITLVIVSTSAVAQQCITDSNYYSLSYKASNNNFVIGAIHTSENEIIALCRNSVNSSYVVKFTAQGNVIWSNEYNPNYPHDTWQQYPWYNNTIMEGIIPAADGSFYIYGSSYEHGKSINNVEDPPGHLVGLIINIDKFGNIISAKYIGYWRTDYTVNSLLQMNDGGLVVYLRSHFVPYTSKIILFDKNGNILWGVPVQPANLYTEVADVNPLMKQLSNGTIAVASIMKRDIADTLIYPFLAPIFLWPPPYFFNFIILDSQNGDMKSQTSDEGPSLIYSNITGDFTPKIKSIQELPDGNISFCADVYMPTDSLIFFKHTTFSKRAVNFITTDLGFFLKLISYSPQNNPCILQSVWQTGKEGEQVLLVKDSTNQQLTLFGIDNKGQVEWTKSYSNPIATNNSQGIVLQQNNKGYFIFQSDAGLQNFNLLVTNSKGEDSCVQFPVTPITAQDDSWPWPNGKVQLFPTFFDADFRYSSFNMLKKSHPVSQNTICEYEFACCKDVIDSLHPHNIFICENETYTLPDNTVIKNSSTYYQTLKTERGCDSVVFYNIQVVKLPSHLTASPDTCLKDEVSHSAFCNGRIRFIYMG